MDKYLEYNQYRIKISWKKFCKQFIYFSIFLRILANLPESVVNTLPKDLNTGVYYGWASLHGKVYKMVASIGWNPYYKNEKKSMVRNIISRYKKVNILLI